MNYIKSKIKNMNWLHKGILSFIGVGISISLVFFVNAEEDPFTFGSDFYNTGYNDSNNYLTTDPFSTYVDFNDPYGVSNYNWSWDSNGVADPSTITGSNSSWIGGNSMGDCLRNDCNQPSNTNTNVDPYAGMSSDYFTKTCPDGKVISAWGTCPDTSPTREQICSDSESAGIVSPGYCSTNTTVPNINTGGQLYFETSKKTCSNGTTVSFLETCPEDSSGATNVIRDDNSIVGNAKVTGAYPVIIGDSSIYSGWGTSRSVYSGYNSTIYNRPIVSTNVVTVTRYECADGTIVDTLSKCPAGSCANGAIDYPTCVNFKRCTNGATNYPTCDACADGYDLIPGASSGAQRCVAKCDVYSERDVSTGACKLKACTNGALTAPFCRDCPAGMDMWNGSCVASCPNNQYRTSSGCIEYRCTNGATDYPNCASCPAGKFLHSDGICRACDTGTSWNGNACVKNACANDATNYPECNLCVTGMEYVSSQSKCMYPCPSGYVRNGIRCDIINTSCSNNAVNYPNCNQCPNGYEYVGNSSSCLQNCPSGYIRGVNGNCNINTVTCWNGERVNVNQSCPLEYKHCDNGMMVSAYATCPISTYNQYTTVAYNTQYTGVNNAGGTPIAGGNVSIKVCADGTRVAMNSNCPIASTGAHKVNTTHASNVSNTSAVCNAVANIYAGMPSYGWIEWGTMENKLDKKTPMQYIGREPVVSYSAPMTDLSPSTLYFCRAVLANNNGTYRGDILSVITKDKAVTYATAKVEKVTVKNNVKKVTVTTPSYACTDDYGNKTTVKGGEKMLSLSIDKSVLNYVKGDKVNYVINYKNISKVAVKNIEVKVSLPKEIININSSKGEISDNNVILKIDELGAKAEGVILINAEVGTLTEGRNVTVAGIIEYDIPSKEGLRDEVSAINVGIVKSGDGTPASSEGKAKVKTTDSFLPNTLVEWLILIIIIFGAIVGFRAWKAKREDSHH